MHPRNTNKIIQGARSRALAKVVSLKTTDPCAMERRHEKVEECDAVHPTHPYGVLHFGRSRLTKQKCARFSIFYFFSFFAKCQTLLNSLFARAPLWECRYSSRARFPLTRWPLVIRETSLSSDAFTTPGRCLCAAQSANMRRVQRNTSTYL